MNIPALIANSQFMIVHGKGLLAMDESNATCNRRFADAGIAQSVEMRRAWRELLLTAPGLSECISGVILYDETVRQESTGGQPFARLARDAGLMVGIKVDTGAKNLAGRPGEKVTEGLDGLRERLHAYVAMGASFAKWRGVIAVDQTQLPTTACIEANAHALARYAALCQEAGLVPIVEPEVLMDGTHTQARCQEVTEAMLRSVFEQLARQGAVLEALILKPNMVIAGLGCSAQNTAAEVAGATLQCLRRAVPAAVPGVMFLSGGQSAELASSRLNALHAANAPANGQRPPWTLSFSFARALQQPALGLWSGQTANRAAAQQALLKRARCNRAALLGEYSAALEAL